MKSERLMDLFSEIDPELIESADIRPAKKKTVIAPMIISLAAAAACIAVVISVGYYVKNVKGKPRQIAADRQGITMETVASVIDNYRSDTAEKKVDVKINEVKEYGISLSFTVNNEEDYNKYYAYNDFILYKETEDGDVPVPTLEADQQKQTLVPEIDTAVGEKPIINVDIKKQLLFDKEETDMNIFWMNKYGELEKGDYYITINVYKIDKDTETIPYELHFTIE